MDKFVFVGIGEILWDLLPSGKQLGGAVANFAYHAAAQGETGIIVSAVGDDDYGHEIRKQLNKHNLSDIYIATDPAHPTGTVSVELDKQGHPSYIIHEHVAWDFIPENDQLLDLAKTADVVCFGTLSQRSSVSQQTINSFLQHTPDDCLKIFDINLRQHFYSKSIIKSSLNQANILKLNDDELPVLCKMLAVKPESENDKLSTLLHLFSLDLIVLTKGSYGSVLMSKDETSVHPGYPVQIKDTVGAGDSFTATVAVGLKNGLDLGAINDNANKTATFVCSQHGAMPVYKH